MGPASGNTLPAVAARPATTYRKRRKTEQASCENTIFL